MAETQVEPYVLAMVICDGLHVDPATRKPTLLGIFSVLNAPSLPVQIPQLVVYVVLTGMHGLTDIRLVLVDAEEKEPPIWQTSNPIPVNDPRMIVDVFNVAMQLVFPAAGEYRVQLYAGNSFLIERRIVIVGPPTAPTHGESQ